MLIVKTTLIYTAILGLMFVALSIRVIRGRFSSKVSLGDGGHSHLNIAIRTHANFAECIPLALLLLMGVESLNYPVMLVHAFGIILILGRIGHAYGIAQKNSVGPTRPAGMIATMTVMVVSSVLILIKSF